MFMAKAVVLALGLLATLVIWTEWSQLREPKETPASTISLVR